MSPVKRKLNILRSVKPTTQEKEGFRTILRARIEYDMKLRAAPYAVPVFGGISAWLKLSRLVPATLLVALFAMGTGAAFASQNAIPGDILYPVKITTEQIRVSITADEAKKATLHLEFAAQRLREMARLAEENRLDAPDTILANYQAELQKSRDLLRGNQGKAAKIAELIDTATQAQQTAIAELSRTIPDNEDEEDGFSNKLKDMKERIEEHNDEASFVLITDRPTATANATTTDGIPASENRPFKKSDEKIKKAKEKISEVSEKLRRAGVDEITITKVNARLGEATNALERAQETRNGGLYQNSLTESVRARAIAHEAEKMIKEQKKKGEKKNEEKDRDENIQDNEDGGDRPDKNND